MFTLEQIKAAHSKVKSGADFPAYVHEIKKLGVTYYSTYLDDGHTIFHGKNGFELTSQAKYNQQNVSTVVNAAQLRADILNHQAGGSDFFQITRQAAGNGIEKWAVCMDTMTCTYYDLAGNKILVEVIPELSDATL